MHKYAVLKSVLLASFLTLQTAIQPLVVRKLVPRDSISSACILVTEILKVITCVLIYYFLEHRYHPKKSWVKLSSLKTSVSTAAVPAIVYALQNIAITHAQRNLDGLTYNIINQSKLLSAAVMSYLVLGRKQNRGQSIALFGLVVASGMAVVSTSASTSISSFESNTWAGLVAALTASGLSGLSGALSDKALQVRSRNSFLFSAELSSYVILTMLIGLTVEYISNPNHCDVTRIVSAGGLFSAAGITSTTSAVLIPISLGAFGGILVGQVTKLVGNVRKGFAVCGGIVVAALIDSLREDSTGGPLLFFSIPLAVLAVASHGWFSGQISKK